MTVLEKRRQRLEGDLSELAKLELVYAEMEAIGVYPTDTASLIIFRGRVLWAEEYSDAATAQARRDTIAAAYPIELRSFDAEGRLTEVVGEPQYTMQAIWLNSHTREQHPPIKREPPPIELEWQMRFQLSRTVDVGIKQPGLVPDDYTQICAYAYGHTTFGKSVLIGRKCRVPTAWESPWHAEIGTIVHLIDRVQTLRPSPWPVFKVQFPSMRAPRWFGDSPTATESFAFTDIELEPINAE